MLLFLLEEGRGMIKAEQEAETGAGAGAEEYEGTDKEENEEGKEGPFHTLELLLIVATILFCTELLVLE